MSKGLGINRSSIINGSTTKQKKNIIQTYFLSFTKAITKLNVKISNRRSTGIRIINSKVVTLIPAIENKMNTAPRINDKPNRPPEENL
jgi:hypothetical protein